MKIAIFTEYFEHDKNSAGRHMFDLVRKISLSSNSIDVFTLYKHTGKSSFDELDNVEIHSLRVDLDAKNNSLFARFFTELSISFRALLLILRLKKLAHFDVLIWYSPTIFWGPIIKIMDLFKSSHKYMILRDIFPQWAVDVELIPKNSLQHKILKTFENFQYNTADIIAIQTEGNKEYFKKLGKFTEKIKVLRTWYDISEHNSLPESLERILPQNKKILLYAGNLGLAQNQSLLTAIVHNMKYEDQYFFTSWPKKSR